MSRVLIKPKQETSQIYTSKKMNDDEDDEYIVDTDAGVDDAIAISTLLKLNKKVAAITVVDGNTPTLIGYQNVKKLLTKYNNTSAKVYKGKLQNRVCLLCSKYNKNI